VDDALLEFLERLAEVGEDNDARETARPKRMLEEIALKLSGGT